MLASNPLPRNCSCLRDAARAMVRSCSGLSMKQIIRSIVRITRDAWLCSSRLTRSCLSSEEAAGYVVGVESRQRVGTWHSLVLEAGESRSATDPSEFNDMSFMSHSKYFINSGFFWKRLNTRLHGIRRVRNIFRIKCSIYCSNCRNRRTLR